METPKTIGRYEIIEEVGRGAMGAVYKARDPRIGRIVALKTVAFSFPLGPGEEEEFLKRFYNEAQIAGRLNHPNIVTIYDVGEKEAEGEAYIAMEFVTGTNLHDLLAGGGRLPLTQVAEVMTQLSQALDFAHENGVVHRDIKPANIILTETGQAKILDFGIARLAAGGLTRPGRFFGTPNYMAPEQVTGLDVDGRADQFSLCVILYQLLTGEKPFVGESVTAISYQVVNIDPPPVTKLNPSLLPVFDRILRKALAKGPSDRYPRCSEFAEDLREAVASWKASADRTTPRTLVSGRDAGVRPVAGSSEEGGVRGITFLAPRWAAILARARTPRGLGWIGFVASLVLLASAPFLLYRSHASRGSSRTVAAIAAPWGGTSAPAPPEPEPAPADPALSGKLALRLQHRGDSSMVTVRLDGRQVLQESIRGGSKKQWGRTLPVAPGRHRVEVRLRSGDKSFDDVEGLDADIRAHEIRTLRMTMSVLTRRLKLHLDPPASTRSR
jgi:eukaryotic-like serine/threonine-protein kinase